MFQGEMQSLDTGFSTEIVDRLKHLLQVRSLRYLLKAGKFPNPSGFRGCGLGKNAVISVPDGDIGDGGTLWKVLIT